MAIDFTNAQAGPSSPPTGRIPAYQLHHTLKAHTRGITALKFSADGKVLVSAGADGYLNFWEPESGEHLRSLQSHRSGINDLTLSPDSLYLATSSDTPTIHVHPLHPLPLSNPADSQPPPLRSLTSHTAPVLCIAFSPKSNLLVSGSYDESAIIWDVKGGKALRTLPAHAEAVWCVGWDGEGGMVVTGSGDGLIRLWDVNTGQCLKTLDNETNSPVSFASFTPSSYFLLSGSLDSTLRVYNIHSSKVLKTFRASGVYISEKYPSQAIVYPALGQEQNTQLVTGNEVRRRVKREAWVIAGSENGRILIWEMGSRKVVQVLEGHVSPVVALAVHPKGRIIVTGSLEIEKTINIWKDDQ